MYAFRILTRQPVRCMLTVAGIALCIVLMLFLLSVYAAVAEGSVEYIARNRTDLWVLQKNATNILRGSSMLTTAHGMALRQTDGVESVAPILLILTTVKRQGENATLFLAGYDPAAERGGPPSIGTGRGVLADDEIVIDRSFAAKYGISVGEVITVQDDSLRVVGFSTGTNAFVIQYGFVTLRRAQSLIGFPGLVTCYLVTVHTGMNAAAVGRAIRDDLPGIEVFDAETFLRNNVHEMESGFLPILYAIAALGAVVLTSILTLLLTVIILESRRDFAVMRALGSPDGFLRRVILAQALILSAGGTVAAIGLFSPLALFIEWMTPEVSTHASLIQTVAVAGVVLAITICSAWRALRRLRGIYPLEAFT